MLTASSNQIWYSEIYESFSQCGHHWHRALTSIIRRFQHIQTQYTQRKNHLKVHLSVGLNRPRWLRAKQTPHTTKCITWPQDIGDIGRKYSNQFTINLLLRNLRAIDIRFPDNQTYRMKETQKEFESLEHQLLLLL